MEAWKLLVYDVGIDSKMTAKNFMELSESSKIKLLMSKTSDETFVNDFKLYLFPYLRNIGKKDYKKRQELLHEFLVEIAKTDLTCCLKLLEKCSPEVIIFGHVHMLRFPIVPKRNEAILLVNFMTGLTLFRTKRSFISFRKFRNDTCKRGLY